MPRFYFHLYNDEITLDEEGHDFDTVEEARQDAVLNLRSLGAEHVLQGRLKLTDRIEVVNGGVVVATVTMRDAVTVEG